MTPTFNEFFKIKEFRTIFMVTVRFIRKLTAKTYCKELR